MKILEKKPKKPKIYYFLFYFSLSTVYVFINMLFLLNKYFIIIKVIFNI